MDHDQTHVDELRKLPLFRDLDEQALVSLAARLVSLAIPGGSLLFSEGEAADAVYVVLSGAFVARKGAQRRVVGYISPGETVGEMALLSGKSRSASVVAVRDSEVLRFATADFEQLLTMHASAMAVLTRLAFQRLDLAMSQPRRRPSKALALLGPNIAGLEQEAHRFVEALARFQRVELLTEARCSQWRARDFQQLENAEALLLYLGAEGAWAQRCARQSDQVLFLARADAAEHSLPDYLGELEKDVRLLLLHEGPIRPGRARAWKHMTGLSMHHHVRHAEDWRRVARLLTGRGVALVLSGGGARGFAHLGVIQALREAGVEIDQVAGTSIGAVIAAGIALEWNDLELYTAYKRSFVDTNPLNDYTLPFVSLVAGRKAARLLRHEYGDRDIEDLPMPYFCVSSNLTRAESHVHSEGLLWRALRASIAIPGVLPPVFENGEVLVDGGVIDNLPVNLMRPRHFGPVIGVDVAGEQALSTNVDEAFLPTAWRMVWDHVTGRARRPGIVSILLRAGMVNSATTSSNNRMQSDLLVQPPVAEIELLNWGAFERAIEIGYRHTQKILENWSPNSNIG